MTSKLREQRRRRAAATRRKRFVRFTVLGGLLILTSIFVVWRTNQPAEPLASETSLALGAQVYTENCMACHGPNGEGHAEVASAPALNASEHAWHHADGQLQEVILNGGQIMPPFKDQLTNNEVIAVVRYFQTWWTASMLQSQQSLSAQLPFQE